MPNDERDMQEFRRRVEEQVRKERSASRWTFFGINAALFVLFNSFAWWMVGSPGVLPNPSAADSIIAALVMLGAGWLIGLIFLFVSAVMDLKSVHERMKTSIASREISRAMLRGDMPLDGGLHEKAKRVMRLSDDGELEAVPLEGDAPQEKLLRR